VGLNSLKNLNLTNVYPNNKKNKKNKVKSKPLELRSRVKSKQRSIENKTDNQNKQLSYLVIFLNMPNSKKCLLLTAKHFQTQLTKKVREI
jgi:hypothetical protein